MKVVAVILLVVGIALGALGVHQYFLTGSHALCGEYTAGAVVRLQLAQAAAGTPQAEALKSEADDAMAGARTVCQVAREARGRGMTSGSGALLSLIISGALLMLSRRTGREGKSLPVAGAV